MYITGHVHTRHSSIALGGSATHPKLGRAWALGWVWSARPLEGSAEGGFVIGFLSGGSSAVVCRGQVVGVSQSQRVTLHGWVWQLQYSKLHISLQGKPYHTKAQYDRSNNHVQPKDNRYDFTEWGEWSVELNMTFKGKIEHKKPKSDTYFFSPVQNVAVIIKVKLNKDDAATHSC